MLKELWSVKEIADATNESQSTIKRKANKGHWLFSEVKSRGGQNGKSKRFYLEGLPKDIQKALILSSNEFITAEDLEQFDDPEVQLAGCQKLPGEFSFAGAASRKEILSPQGKLFGMTQPNENAAQLEYMGITQEVLHDDRVGDLAQIVAEATSVPREYKKSAWIQIVAIKHSINRATLYRYIRKYNRAGLAALKHRKQTRGQARSWTPEAIDFWLGLCLKKEHRKISRDSLYECLRAEARSRSWQIGSYRSALWWFDKKITPQLLALQRGGSRALDNTLPPICRDYSDLKPFEILVGDQHRFDFWVMDDETGEVFRPEGYFWQDLRTRCFYGGALAERYDSHLMGLALRIGLKRFGAFGWIYTDHGKPEESRYIMGILKEMRALNLGVEQTLDVPIDTTDADPETMTCGVTLPGAHRKAIVRNAKAKMIESTNRALENLLRNQLKVPGYTKRLTASQEEQEVDEKDAARLARSGRLMTFWEFALAVYRAMDHYNARKPHRGVLSEWLWHPKPKETTPMHCLQMCYAHDGWRPRKLPDDAIDLVFLPREHRVVDRGRITFQKERYEHEALIPLNGRRVELRHDPLDSSWLLVFLDGEFLCRATPTEYSSMTDRELASRKIDEKARRRKRFYQQYHELTSSVPDFREYSKIPAAERAAAVMGKAKRDALETRTHEIEFYRDRTPEELAAEAKQIQTRTHEIERRQSQRRTEKLKPRPSYWLSDFERFRWCMDYELAGAPLSDGDRAFCQKYREEKLDVAARQYWDFMIDYNERERGERQEAATAGDQA